MRPQGSHVRCAKEGRFLETGSLVNSESLTGLKPQRWLHRATGCASKPTELEENEGVPFLRGLLGWTCARLI